jgi:septal ring factor EnvC (AmiA/AmiB activator)
MKKLVYLFILIFLFALSAHAQTNCTTIEDCQSKNAQLEKNLSQASQMIQKLLDVSQAKTDVIAVKDAEIESRKNLEAINERLLAKKDAEIADQQKLIGLLQKKAQRKFSILFGLISLRF